MLYKTLLQSACAIIVLPILDGIEQGQVGNTCGNRRIGGVGGCSSFSDNSLSLDCPLQTLESKVQKRPVLKACRPVERQERQGDLASTHKGIHSAPRIALGCMELSFSYWKFSHVQPDRSLFSTLKTCALSAPRAVGLEPPEKEPKLFQKGMAEQGTCAMQVNHASQARQILTNTQGAQSVVKSNGFN